ncbi:MAG: hypothetical protein WC455_23650 [Dehalococcoidia bacterium]|jgi:hypothetical protein
MLTALTAATFNNLGFDAGILLKNFDYSSATDAGDLATLVAAAKAAGTTLLGATKGGLNVSDIPTYFNPDIDGMRGPIKSARYIIDRLIKSSGTLVELRSATLKDIIAAADAATVGDITTITPRADLEDDDYIDNLVWIGDVPGDGGLVLVEFDNALNTNGLTITIPKNDNATFPFEFTAHQTDPDGVVPYRILLFAGVSSAAFLEVFSVEGAESGDTRLAVSPQKTALQSYVTKTAASVALPELGDILVADANGWVAWDGDTDVTATTGNQIVVAIITTSTGAVVYAGRDTVKSKA